MTGARSSIAWAASSSRSSRKRAPIRWPSSQPTGTAQEASELVRMKRHKYPDAHRRPGGVADPPVRCRVKPQNLPNNTCENHAVSAW